MKNKKLIESILAILIIIIGAVGLSGCVDEKNKFIGTWRYSEGGTITFNSDNTVSIDNIGPLIDLQLIGIFDYKIENLQITFSSGSVGVTLNYNFVNSNTLELSNDAGLLITLTKK